MALFGGGKEKKENIRNELMQKLSANEYLESLIRQVLILTGKLEPECESEEEKVELLNTRKEHKWLTECQSYYDTRRRMVVIEDDLFAIRWISYRTETYVSSDGSTHNRQVEDTEKHIGYAYTADGYRPLHSYVKGETRLEKDEVIECWANVIKERLEASFPEFSFNNSVVCEKGQARFSYYVPELEWKDWF